MNKLFMLLLGSCFVVSCATTGNVSPILVGRDSNVVLEMDQLKQASKKLTIENKAISLLNQLFTTDVANKDMVLVIINESDCDFTMDISGDNHYSLPVGAKKSESIVVQQGDYEMRSQVCNGYYRVNKTFSENTQLSIKYSVIKNINPENTTAGIQ